MKTRSFLLSTLAAFMLAGCSSEEAGENNIPGDDLNGKAYLSLSLKSHSATTRVATATKPGSEGESHAGNVTVLLFDKDDVCLDVVDFNNAEVGNSGGEGNPTAAASEAKLVPEKSEKVFVVINPYSAGWDLSKDAVKGKPWNTINAAIDATIANVTGDRNFMMASAGTTDAGALTDVKSNVFKATPENEATAKDQAKANPAIINVDRLSAKVEVAVKSPDFTKPEGSSFTFGGWELSVTNKSVKLYSDLITYANATEGAVYRRDKNYLLGEQPTGGESAMDAAFDYLKNIDSQEGIIPDVAQTDGASRYCLENTMDAEAQKLGFTTKVVVKAQYTPKGIGANNSYFSWKGNYYTLEGLQKAYKETTGGGLKTDLPIFLKKAGIVEEGVLDIDKAIEELTTSNFNEKTGIIGRFCAVRYYHSSVCYYDVLIRHDQAITTKMALGRYGVVRNNWYHLELQSVSGPGTPWIPDPSDPDPTNPTPPDTDDDEADAYLSVQITINPWTFWTQGVDLH